MIEASKWLRWLSRYNKLCKPGVFSNGWCSLGWGRKLGVDYAYVLAEAVEGRVVAWAVEVFSACEGGTEGIVELFRDVVQSSARGVEEGWCGA